MENTGSIAPKQVRALKGLPVIVMSQWAGDYWLITPVLSTKVPRTPNEYMMHSNEWPVCNGTLAASVSEKYLLDNSELLGEITETDRLFLCWQFFDNIEKTELPKELDPEEVKMRCGTPWPEDINVQVPLWDLVKNAVLSDDAAFKAVLEPLDPEDGEELDESPEALEKEKEMILERVHNCIDGADYVGEEDLRDRLRQCVNLVMWSLSLYDKAVCNSKEE